MTVELSKLNFRDLGGLPAADGKLVRDNVIYRSEGPASFLGHHRAELEELGIKLICDLRSEVERKAAPNDWSRTARLLDIEITNDLRNAAHGGWAALKDNPTEAAARNAMRVNYQATPGALHRHIAQIIDAVIARETPVLLHCTAGKDRTGVLVAMLLALLGVTREDIVADYMRSDIFGKNLLIAGSIEDSFQKTFGFIPTQAVIDAMIGVDPEFLEAAFDTIDQEYGSIPAYFESAGVDAGKVKAFRDAVLERDRLRSA